MTSPLSHALANVMKRATVITCAMLYAYKPVSPLHVAGVALSVLGTLSYHQLDSCSARAASEASDRPASAAYALLPQRAPSAGKGGASASGGQGAGGAPESETTTHEADSSSSSNADGDSPPTTPRRQARAAADADVWPAPTT